MLRLEVLDWAGPASWRWRLTEADGGKFLADHTVTLDPNDWRFEAFADLHGYLEWNAAPDRRLESEAELCAQVGAWIGEQVLGPVAAVLARERRPVRLEVPAQAGVLAYRPLELARVRGRPLAAHRVSFVIDLQPRQPLAKRDVAERLRMLAVFSLPEDASALNLRRERYALARLIHEIAATHGKAIELRVLQYGATRERLEDALLEQAGWDVVHISGHGLPAGLILEDDAGRRDIINSRELVDLLDLAADQIKLVTLSACESAAVTAAEHLQHLGLATPGSTAPQDNGADGDGGADVAADEGAEQEAEGSLPAVAAELVRRLDCAVLAMRYPVVDEFAVNLAGWFYRLLLGKDQPVARALALSLPKVAPEQPRPGAPALSVATPALFGADAVELQLTPPPGGPVVFDAERQKLAGFPPQPARFVGRVGPMTRANTALAPRSDHTAVLFHGMAGAGKTACALELAYSHEAEFARLIWHQAPPEDHDITGALTAFALDLEQQLPGIKLAHLVDDTTALTNALPALRQFFGRERILLVLDNLESLLTPEGTWRDERWPLLVDALTGHGGLSRVVLTSRRRAAGLNEAVAVEPVHALSLAEAVLLAREWPHLRALLDGITPGLTSQQAHRLAARTLAVVQGHPKLIELADGQATNPQALAARLDEADHTWTTSGTRLDAFLKTGEPTAGAEDYLEVLEGWTRGATTALPADTTTLFWFLCCLEEDDREHQIVKATWAYLWRRLDRPDDPPEPAAALAPLVDRALVAVDTDPDTGRPDQYRIHPSVAGAGRAAAGPAFAAAVDTSLADYWLVNLEHGQEREAEEGLGWLVRHAARAVIPYLLRRQEWRNLIIAAGEVLAGDSSLTTAAALLPALAAAADATRGTDDELSARRGHALTLARLRPAEAEPLLRRLLNTATEQQLYGMARRLASDLFYVCRDSGRLDEALALNEAQADYTRRAGYGPWSQLSVQVQRLEILGRQGHREQVLAAVEELRATMATLPDPPDPPDDTEAVEPFQVREGLLRTGAFIATILGLWQRSLDLNAEQLASKRRRGASGSDLAESAFYNYGPMLMLGRAEQARELLRQCRTVFEADHNIGMLGTTHFAQAKVEHALGHGDRAIALEQDALRYFYLVGDPDDIKLSHSVLAEYLDRYGGDRRWTAAHYVAAAIIDYQTGSNRLVDDLAELGGILADDPVAPSSFKEVCALVDDIEGVHLAELLSRLPRRAPDGETAMAEVLRLASEAHAEQHHHVLDVWESALSALLAAHHPDTAPDTRAAAIAALDSDLEANAEQPDWQALVAVLRRIHAGERDPALTDGLDDIDTTIVQRALDALAGRAEIDPDAWHTLATQQKVTMAANAVVAAVGGDCDARRGVQPQLEQLATDPDWAQLADVLRRILAGERDPALTDGLDDDTDTALVTAVLGQLARVTSSPTPQHRRSKKASERKRTIGRKDTKQKKRGKSKKVKQTKKSNKGNKK